MTELSRFAKIAQMGRAARLARRGAQLDRASADERRAVRDELLRETIRHAARRSRLYREHWGAGAEDAPLHELAPMTKAQAMERFADWVVDPRLRLDELTSHLDGLRGDELHLGAYRVMSTGGSSRLPGVFVYDQAGWDAVLSTTVRASRMLGTGPRLGRRRRVAWVGAPTTRHMARRVVDAMDVGVFRTLTLSATDPVERIVDDLNRFGPELFSTYPSIGAVLAVEQLEGRLRIAPSSLLTSSEPCTPPMAARMEEAWGMRPADMYSTTETGPAAGTCDRHDGLHLFEDLSVVEIVDGEGRPVPPGTPGAKAYVTNLHNRVQPIVRMELSDVLCLDPEPCPCGRTSPVLRPVQGRTDDMLELSAPDGRPVAVHPTAFAAIGADGDVRDWELVQTGGDLRLRMVARAGCDRTAVAGRLQRTVRDAVERTGAVPPRVDVAVVDAIARDPARAGKHKLVRRETAAGPLAVAL